jgi:lipopolysaccharide export system protein LptA
MKNLQIKSTAIFFLTVILFFSLRAQQDDKVILLHHADSLVGNTIDGQNIRELIGNVEFSQGNVIVNCDRAIQYFKPEQIHLLGNVVVRDDTVTIKSNRGFFYSNEKIAEGFDGVHVEEGSKKLDADYGKYFVNEKKIFFSGNVLVKDTNAILTCDKLTYFRDTKKTIAESNVHIVDLKSSFQTFGNYFENENNISRIADQPRVLQIDTTSEGEIDTLQIVSDSMYSRQDSVVYFSSIGNVIISRGDVSAECGRALYYTDADSIILRQTPYVWYAETQVNGDSIFIKLRERKLETIFVSGNAFAISRSDSIYKNRYDQMSGETITMDFDSNKIQNITVNNTASSVYYLYEEVVSESDSLRTIQNPNGLNVTTGDQVIINFVDKRVETIRIIGGVEGKYYPENIIRKKETDYNLAGFNWRENKPVIKPMNNKPLSKDSSRN